MAKPALAVITAISGAISGALAVDHHGPCTSCEAPADRGRHRARWQHGQHLCRPIGPLVVAVSLAGGGSDHALTPPAAPDGTAVPHRGTRVGAAAGARGGAEPPPDGPRDVRGPHDPARVCPLLPHLQRPVPVDCAGHHAARAHPAQAARGGAARRARQGLCRVRRPPVDEPALPRRRLVPRPDVPARCGASDLLHHRVGHAQERWTGCRAASRAPARRRAPSS